MPAYPANKVQKDYFQVWYQEEKSNFGRLGLKQPPVFLKMLNRELVTSFSLFLPLFNFFFFIIARHMQILTLRPCGQGGNGTFIVEAGPANAISGRDKVAEMG